ncbi:hypothetical protein [Croceitalea rosinachiae]|uniref:Tetratricopeptide repeat protein n=1 Tax=Croceitalea rosinachiae TaxID=3075596 RepID=A0ABU3A7X9_9FLAO|nr:hypothetical protein [Croceitalea sp. F388]MDT0605988.1 hypothetical protein [Croceitalea sp. F388]
MPKNNRHLLLVPVLVFFLLTITNCAKNSNSKGFDYGTKNDSARMYFQKGWQEIMDYGRWTASEIAFRKAHSLDPNWALGKSMVGRITRNLKERQQILKELQKIKHKVKDDERLLLDVNILSLIAANNRGQGLKNTKELHKNRWVLAENNFGIFAQKHPKDNYFKAEYIEVLHLNHGAQTALDSLKTLATSKQMELGFFIAYEASLQLELGNLKKTVELLKKLEAIQTDTTYNIALVLRAKILKKQDSIQEAQNVIDQVIKKDTNHLIAMGLRQELKKILKKS